MLVGVYLYYQSAENAAASTGRGGEQHNRVLVTTGLTGLFIVLLLLLAADLLSLPVTVALVLMLLLIVLCGWLDARLQRSLAAAPMRS